MSPEIFKFAAFGRTVASILRDNPEWSSDTTQAIADAAANFGIPLEADPPMVAACQNCSWRGGIEHLQPIRDYSERVADGEPEPAGECPECGALAHVVEDAE